MNLKFNSFDFSFDFLKLSCLDSNLFVTLCLRNSLVLFKRVKHGLSNSQYGVGNVRHSGKYRAFQNVIFYYTPPSVLWSLARDLFQYKWMVAIGNFLKTYGSLVLARGIFPRHFEVGASFILTVETNLYSVLLFQRNGLVKNLARRRRRRMADPHKWEFRPPPSGEDLVLCPEGEARCRLAHLCPAAHSQR